jgi:uncharacterized protein with GYD domain
VPLLGHDEMWSIMVENMGVAATRTMWLFGKQCKLANPPDESIEFRFEVELEWRGLTLTLH